MRSTVLFLQRYSQSHRSHVARLAKVQMLMVEGKQSKGRLVAASSPSASPSSTVKRAPSLKGSEEWHNMDRIDLLELKGRIVKQVGAEKANRYFSHFKSFLSSRLSKVELDKFVVMTIGKENVGLHNQFVKAILTNAVKAKTPPPPLPPVQHAGKPPLKPHSPFITSEDIVPHASPSTMSNGDSFLPSPRRGRSIVARDHKASPLGPREDQPTPDLSRPMQQLDGSAKQLDVESISSLEHPLKRVRVIPPLSDDSVTIAESGRHQNTLRRDERVRILPPFPFGSSTKTPPGMPFHSEAADGGWRWPALHAFPAHLLLQDEPDKDSEGSGDLPDNEFMLRLMEEAAASEGLEGVSRESAAVLNIALDGYLRRLIKSLVDVPGSRASAGADLERPAESTFSRDKMKEALLNMKLHRGMNGVSLGPIAEFLKKGKEKVQPSLSLSDFKAAMELNPQQLGENWPVQLEKISFRFFDQ
ncbi:hypothetical protein L7F22_060061 [Adiantum nelumboides]|nr:hypothetical protein [Adiantum nelumboides]